MSLPQGYCPKGEILTKNSVCKLHKSLYDLKQVSRQWYAKFSSALFAENFKQSTTNHSLFIKRDSYTFMAILVYMDDIIIASNNDSAVASLKRSLDSQFKLKDLVPLRFFLGLEIACSPNGIVISQRSYAL